MLSYKVCIIYIYEHTYIYKYTYIYIYIHTLVDKHVEYIVVIRIHRYVYTQKYKMLRISK